MPWQMHPKEHDKVSKLRPAERYEYAVNKMADWEEVWALRSPEGKWAYAHDESSQPVFPIWPHPQFAADCATGDWSADKPSMIPLKALLTTWLPGLERDGRRVGVFPTPGSEYAILEPRTFRQDIERACTGFGGL